MRTIATAVLFPLLAMAPALAAEIKAPAAPPGEFAVTVGGGNGLQLKAQAVKGFAELCGIEIATARAVASAPAAVPVSRQGIEVTVAGQAMEYLVPDRIVTSTDAVEPDVGWYTVDGDTNTVWSGSTNVAPAWLVFDYDAPVLVRHVDIGFADCVRTNLVFLGSDDGTALHALGERLEHGGARLRQLWMVFPPDAAGTAPVIREIRVGGNAVEGAE